MYNLAMRTIKRDIVGAFIFSKDGKLLLGKSHKGGVYDNLWIVPGGGIEDGETKLQALRREIIEETGIDIRGSAVLEMEGSGSLSGESEKNLRQNGERVLVKMTFHNFRVILDEISSKVILKTDDDFKEASWFSTQELAHIEVSPPTLTSLKILGLIN
jgi:8-oxo-dGTP pyrophosphatase MutT (NUDIX family)